MNSFPSFYDPARIGTLFYPDMAAIAAAAAKANLPPAADAGQTVRLFIIDMQVDFCHPHGSLFVPGAQEDMRRLIEFIYRHAAVITGVTCTLDSHLPFQIFHPAWWTDAEGRHPAPFTLVTAADVAAGRWRPLRMPDYSRAYVRQLEEQAKKQLTIWPYHVLLGSLGNALDPELWSAVMYHALARQAQPTWEVKGRIPQTEHYSAVQPEIPLPGHPEGERNVAFLNAIAESDYVFLAGEAESHCVLETLHDVVEAFAAQPDVLRKIYVLQDCMSSIEHPEVDFRTLAAEQMQTFAAQGVNFIDSTAPLPFLYAPGDDQ